MRAKRTHLLAVSASFVSLLFNALAQFIAGRGLGAADYGLFATLLLSVSISGVLFSGLQVVVARDLISQQGQVTTHRIFDRISVTAISFAVLLTLLTMSFSRYFSLLLHTSVAEICAVGAVFPALAAISIVNGRIQSTEVIHWIAILGLVLSAQKFCIVIIGVALRWNVLTIVAGLVATTIVTAAAAFLMTKERATVEISAWSSEATKAVMVQTQFWIFLGLPVLISRVTMSRSEAGNIALALAVAQSGYFLVMIAFSFLFPRLVVSRSSDMRAFGQGLWLVLALAATSSSFIWLFGPTLLEIFFGDSFDSASRIVRPLAIATVPLAVAGYLTQLALAVNDRWYALSMGIMLTWSAAVLAQFRDSTEQFSYATLAVSLLAVLWLWFVTRSIRASKVFSAA